jgi:hypothetical protein
MRSSDRVQEVGSVGIVWMGTVTAGTIARIISNVDFENLYRKLKMQ